MAYAYWKSGKTEDQSVFDLFFRNNPFHGEFTIFAGLTECLKFIQNFRYTDDGKTARMLVALIPQLIPPAPSLYRYCVSS